MASEIEVLVFKYRFLSVALMAATIAIFNNKSICISKELILRAICPEDVVIAHILQRIILG